MEAGVAVLDGKADSLSAKSGADGSLPPSYKWEGNLAVWVGVRGEESWTLDGEDPSSRDSTLLELDLAESDLLTECRDELDLTEPDERSLSCDLCSRDLM